MIRILVSNMVTTANNNIQDKNNRDELPFVCKYTDQELYNSVLDQNPADFDWEEFRSGLFSVNHFNPILNLSSRMMMFLGHAFSQCFAESFSGYIHPSYAVDQPLVPSQMETFVNLIKQAEKWNNGRDHQFSCVSWLTDDDSVLKHTTTSGRMEIVVTFNEIAFQLNSPSMPNKPYCTVRFTNALDMELVIESGELTISMLSPIVDILQCLNFSRLNAWKWLQNRGSRKLARAARKGEVDHFNYMLRNACDKALSNSYNLDDRCTWDAKTFEDAWQYIPNDKAYQKFAKAYFDNHFLNPKNTDFVEPTQDEYMLQDEYTNLSVLERLERLMND